MFLFWICYKTKIAYTHNFTSTPNKMLNKRSYTKSNRMSCAWLNRLRTFPSLLKKKNRACCTKINFRLIKECAWQKTKKVKVSIICINAIGGPMCFAGDAISHSVQTKRVFINFNCIHIVRQCWFWWASPVIIVLF